MNWNQTGMPSALVNRLRQKRELSEFKSVALETAKRELEDANRRYERLVADLKRRGVGLVEERKPESGDSPEEQSADNPSCDSKSSEDGQAVWEEWDRRFRALLG